MEPKTIQDTKNYQETHKQTLLGFLYGCKRAKSYQKIQRFCLKSAIPAVFPSLDSKLEEPTQERHSQWTEQI